MVTLYLLSEKGFSVLKGVIDAGLSSLVSLVVVGSDSAVGNDYSDQIIDLSKANKIDWCRRGDETDAVTGLAISWRWMIKKKQCPCLYVIHDSPLPKYRGFSPLVSQLINKEPVIGATLLEASEKYDEGNVVYQKSVPISYPCKIEHAISSISAVYIELAVLFFSSLRDKKGQPSVPQNHQDATYSLWRNDEDYFVNWLDSSERIARFIDAVGSPYKGARSTISGQTVVIHDATVVLDVFIENRKEGKVIFVENGCPVVVCGEGLLKILRMESEEGDSLIPFFKFRLRFR